MALSIPRASLYCTFLGVVIFCLITISSYVHIHLLLHFRNYTTIHRGIGNSSADLEVLAYVNSNLIVIHQQQEQQQQEYSAKLSSVPSAASSSRSEVKKSPSSTVNNSIKFLATKKNLTQPPAGARGVTVIDEAVIAKVKSTQVSNSDNANDQKKVDDSDKNAKSTKIIHQHPKGKPPPAEWKKKAVVVKKDPIIANFTVDGWPKDKSRHPTDYVNYTDNTANLIPVDHSTASGSKDDPSGLHVLIAIQSAPKNIKLRNEVRRTWGGSCVTTHSTWCSVVFVLGQLSNNPSDQTVQADLEAESAKHGDILQESFLDSYNNLTVKSIHILKYYVNSVSEESGAGINQFLLKSDDDSFVHLETLWDLAKARIVKKSDNLIGYLQLGLQKHHYLPMAHKPTRSNIRRSTWLKWVVPTYMYSKRFFPQFLSGSGYLVTRKAAGCLLEKSKETDVVIHYTTGQMDRLYGQVLNNLEPVTTTIPLLTSNDTNKVT